MARIDCSVTVDFLTERRRMCLAEHSKCSDECPLGINENGEGLGCDVFEQKFPDRAVEIVQKWSDEHPVKTRLEDFLEKCPKTVLNDATKAPYIKPYHFGYCKDCVVCSLRAKASVFIKCCWDEPADGGATGKAVE